MILLGLQLPPFYNKDWGIHETSKPRRFSIAHNSYFKEGVEVDELWTNKETEEQKVITRRIFSDRIRYRDRNKYNSDGSLRTGLLENENSSMDGN